MLTVDTYSSQQHSDFTAVNILTTSRISKKKAPIKRSRKLATNIKKKVFVKRKKCLPAACGNETGCCSSVRCFEPLRKSKLGKYCAQACSCLVGNRMNDLMNETEPLVGNGTVDRRRVCINVAGKRYETYESTLAKYPETLLALPQRELFYDSLNGEYFFDRNRKAFGAILTYCQTGVLVKPQTLDDRIFAAELRFFGFEAESQAHMPQSPVTETERELPSNKICKTIWELFEFPDTSFMARLVSLFSMSVILLSIVMFCLETLPAFKERTYVDPDSKTGNGTANGESSERTKLVYEPVFFVIEAACIAWFTLEYGLRLIASPRKCRFLYQPLNLIDIVAILPFYITLALKATNTNISSLSILRVLRLVRVFRIFKLSRYSKGLKILGYTFRASLQELGLLAFFLLIGIILFASAAYYCEENMPKTQFESIPHGFWWAIVTMTTVGYGDMYPETFGGKLVGSFCVLVGVLAIAFPVPVIVNNFTYYYTLEQGTPEPLDEEYLESPLADHKDGMSSYGSLADEPTDQTKILGEEEEEDEDDFNQNIKIKRNGDTNGKQRDPNGTIMQDDSDRDSIHCEIESHV